MNLLYGIVAGSQKALEDGRMLGIDGNDRGAVFARESHHQGTGGNEGLFIGKSDDFSGLNGCESGLEPAEADHRGNYYVNVFGAGERTEAIDPGKYLNRLVCKSVGHLAVMRFVADDHVVDLEFPCLLYQKVCAVVRRNQFNLK